MYDDILLPFDGSDGAAAILHHASEIAHRFDATIRVLYVADTTRYSVTRVGEQTVDTLVGKGREVVEEAGQVLDTLATPYETDVVQGNPAPTIAAYAEEYDYDLIIQPTHGRTGLSRHVLGSVSEKVLRLASVPVLTARMRPDEETLTFPYERILLPTDGSEAARRAARHGLSLAASIDASVHVLAAVPENVPERSLLGDEAVGEAAATEAVEAVLDVAESMDVAEPKTHVAHGDPVERIRETIDEHAIHAVVMGTTGRRGTDRILLGSVAERTVRTAPVPVITIGGE
ncbi:universal stress protein [Halodesulfurarchaeum sp. HSR-GB]|uniref:universal stress protein n=1 Tax=Halodesulfurarchaeum sp. HSR-GB TaxID=3074077 RepID=UPI0028548FCD|nr:universal stress protein [Halodesulfurarchaeum sp. HSR-GB]MDR5656998.1 universal stress protein [Halodesulfurarchaeum sp. HSR-GB]